MPPALHLWPTLPPSQLSRAPPRSPPLPQPKLFLAGGPSMRIRFSLGPQESINLFLVMPKPPQSAPPPLPPHDSLSQSPFHAPFRRPPLPMPLPLPLPLPPPNQAAAN